LSSRDKNRPVFWSRKHIDVLDSDATRHAANTNAAEADIAEAHRSRLTVMNRLARPTIERREAQWT